MARSLGPGTVLGRYRVASLLGAGGMGEVYLARDESLDRPVALKILPPELVRNDERVRRFVQEAKSASSLNHPHIVTIYEIGEAEIGSGDGTPAETFHFIAMELVSGSTLRTLIHEKKTDPKTLVRYLAQAADGLAKAHAAGIVHRDLKPENIMVTSDGFAKVVDFGLAKLMEISGGSDDATATGQLRRDTGAGAVLGTVGYMSPEQVLGKPVDHRSDIFSFGCVLYEAATRRRPFEADTDVETLHKILKERPRPIEEINPEVPGELRRAIRRCLATSPDQRWQGMKDLALELAEIADEYDTLSASSGSRAGVSSGALREAPTPRRTRAVVAVALLIGALGLGAAAWSVWVRPDASSQVAPPAMTVRRLMTDLELSEAELSPDGRRLAFIRRQPGSASLWIRQIATGSEIQLVPPQKSMTWPRFSPDAEFVYYSVTGAGAGLQRAGLYRVPVLGGPTRLVSDRIQGHMAFSPDGRRMVFAPTHGNDVPVLIANLDGSDERTLMTGVRFPFFAWSPDGATVAVRENNRELKRWLLSLVRVSDSRKLAVEDTPLWVSDEVWLDANHLAFIGRSQGLESSQIWLTSYPNLAVRQLTRDAVGGFTNLSASADGTMLAAMQERTASELFVAPAGDLSAGRPFASGAGADATGHPFAASDSTVLFYRGGALWTANADGTGQRQLTTDSLVVGRTQVFVSWPANVVVFATDFQQQIWQMTLDGRNLRQLPTGVGAYLMALAGDGRSVIVVENDGNWRLPLDGGAREPAPVPPGSNFGMGYSPDGRFLLLQVNHGTYERPSFTYEVAPAGGGEAVARWPRDAYSSVLRWAPSGDAIDYPRIVDGAVNLWRRPLSGGEPRRLTNFTDTSLSQFAWSIDGRHLYYSRSRTLTKDVVLITNVRPDGKTP